MARNIHGTHSDLIHCDTCGEDFSSTYKRCPFCGARPSSPQATGRMDLTGRLGDLTGRGAASRSSGPARPARPAQSASRRPIDDEDDYVFDGQDVFDDLDRERDRGPVRGGRHLADDGQGLSPTTIIGFAASGVIVLAAILIVILVVLPMIRGGQTEGATNSPNTAFPSSPGTSQSQPVSNSPLPTSPSSTPSTPPTDDPLAPTDSPLPSDPVVSPSPTVSPSPSTSVPPASGGLTLTYLGQARTQFTISDQWPAPIQLQVSGASGTVTWESSNTAVATVSASGLVTGVSRGQAYVTATDGAGNSQTCHVIVDLSGTSAPSAPSSPSTSTSPAPSTSQAPSSGSLSLSREDFTLSSTWPTYTFTVTGASGTVTWSSSNTSVATVDANGKVTMVGKGQCRVTATDASGQTASCIVRCS